MENLYYLRQKSVFLCHTEDRNVNYSLARPTLIYLYQFSSVTPVTGSQFLFTTVAGLLHLQVLNSASSHFPLPFLTPF
jgi:hypothetical protein